MKPPIGLIILLASIPFGLLIPSSARPVKIITVTQTQTGASERPPLDQLKDVGGYRLHLKCSGSGSPGHDIHQDQPELVIDAVKQVVNLARIK